MHLSLPAKEDVAPAVATKNEPAANLVDVFLNSLPALYEISTPEGKRKQQSEIREWLLRSFQADLDEKAERALTVGNFGPLPVHHDFVKFMQELLELYINGLYYSAIAMVGVTAERFCYDLLAVADIKADRAFSNKEQQPVAEMRFIDLIRLLSKRSLIQDSTIDKLHDIRTTRNRYVHPNAPPFETSKKDAKRLIELICEIARIEFGPSGTGVYGIDKGALMFRPRRAATN